MRDENTKCTQMEEKRQFWRLWSRWKVNTKMRIIKAEREGVDWIQVPQDMVVADY
jgi:hypothetical protein